MINLSRCYAIFTIQLVEFRRDWALVFFSFIFPSIFVVALGLGSLNGSSFTMKFAAVDPEPTIQSQAFSSAIAAEGVTLKTMDDAAARAELTQGTVKAILLFPSATEANRGNKTVLLADPLFVNIASSIVQGARARLLLHSGPDADRYGFRLEVGGDTRGLQFNFIFPGILAMALLQIGVFLTATPLLRARENGTLRYLLLTPLTTTELVIGQIGFRAVVAVCQIGLLMTLGSLVTHLSALQWFEVFLASVLGGVMLVTLGYFLAGIPSGLEQGLTAVMILNFVMMFGGNIFWDPSDSTILTILALPLPSSYLADLFRQIINDNPGILPPWADILAMFAFSVLFLFLVVKTFRFDTNRVYRVLP